MENRLGVFVLQSAWLTIILKGLDFLLKRLGRGHAFSLRSLAYLVSEHGYVQSVR